MTSTNGVAAHGQHQAEVSLHFDRRASKFSATAWASNKKITRLFSREVCLSSGLVVVDAGAGPGVLTRVLAGMYPQHKYVNLDLSFQMVKCAQTAGASAVGDIQRLPIRKASADVIIARQVLHYTEQPREVLDEFRSALKPQGKLLLGQFAPGNRDKQDWIRHVLAFRRPLRPAYPTVAEWRLLLRLAGF